MNEDGTFTVVFDEDADSDFMRYVYGITIEEISFDDYAHWPAVFAVLCPSGREFQLADFSSALKRLGFRGAAEEAHRLWVQCCQGCFQLDEHQADALKLDAESTYRLFVHLGVSAKRFASEFEPVKVPSYYKLYWNKTRMGGRDPNEIGRSITLTDAFAALGIQADKLDSSAIRALSEFERSCQVRLPGALKELVSRSSIKDAVRACHPNSPQLVPLTRWQLRRGIQDRQLDGDCAIAIMTPHQGDHEWAVVFHDGDDDARVYVRWDAKDREVWLLTAPTVGMFFWDLAQTGLAWYQETQFEGGKAASRSDIGLVLSS